jgi:hypothetical protein
VPRVCKPLHEAHFQLQIVPKASGESNDFCWITEELPASF